MKNNKKLQEIRNKSLWVVPQTKGGIGKSVISNLILPLVLLVEEKSKIKIYEFDDNNESGIAFNAETLDKIERNTIKINDAEKIVSSTLMINQLLGVEDEQIIIDCGGSGDTIATINYLKDNDISDIVYFIPVNDDVEQFANVSNLISKIRDFDKKSQIYIIFNRASMDRVAYPTREDYFIGFFGDKEYGIDGNYVHIKDQINGYLFINEYKEIKTVKSYYGKTFLEIIPMAQKMIENISILKDSWSTGLKDGSLTQEDVVKANNQFKFFKRAVAICDEIKKEFENIKI